MPTYTIRDPQTGKTVKLTGDSPPTEAELTEIFATLGGASQADTAVPPLSLTEQRKFSPQEAAAYIDQAEQERTRPGREAVQGAAKRIAEMGVRGGAVLRRIPGVNAIAEQLPSVDVPIERTTTAEKVGAGIVDAATIARGGGAVSSAMRGRGLAPRMAAEGVALAGMAGLQGGDPVSAGVAGAAIPVAGAALSRVPAGLRESAQKKVAQALGATKERFKAIAEKRAPEILKRGLRGSRARLLEDATEHAREAGRAVDDVLKGAGGQRVPTAPIIDALEEAKSAFSATRPMPVSQAAKEGLLSRPGIKVSGGTAEIPIVLDQRPIRQLEQLQNTIRELGEDASVEHLAAVRRVWDDVVARAGGFAHRSGGQFGVPLAEQTEAWAKREATKAIRKTLAAEVPDLAKVNAEYAFWKDLKDVLTATQARTQAQGPGLSRMVGGIVGAATGFGSGQDPMSSIGTAVAGGYLAPMVVKAVTSPQMRLASAQARMALADAIESGSVGRMNSAAARILATQVAKAVNQ